MSQNRNPVVQTLFKVSCKCAIQQIQIALFGFVSSPSRNAQVETSSSQDSQVLFMGFVCASGTVTKHGDRPASKLG